MRSWELEEKPVELYVGGFALQPCGGAERRTLLEEKFSWCMVFGFIWFGLVCLGLRSH